MHDSTYMRSIKKTQIRRSRMWNGGCQEQRGGGKREFLVNGHKVSVMQDE